MSVCPFMSGIYQGGRYQPVVCRSDCELKIGSNCSFKLLGLATFKELHYPDTSNSVDKPDTN